ncbi:hypothetical protein ACNKHM_01085 [Shigella sonnei]
MLTFDDGYLEFLSRVFQFWPSGRLLYGPVGSWVNTPADEQVNLAMRWWNREYFATWQQVREVARSRSLRSLLIHGILTGIRLMPPAAYFLYM